MKLTPRAEALRVEPMAGDRFTGPAGSHPLLVSEAPHPVRVSVIRFEPGTRNHWHSHEGGQLLHVLEGEGYVQARGAPLQRIAAGDSISVPPGEEHWHGAGRGSGLTHIAVSVGDTIWHEESPEPE